MKDIRELDESRDRFDREFSEQTIDIRPEDIIGLKGKWGKNKEVKETALLLISFFQKKKCWCSFTLSELMRFSKRNGRNPDLVLYGVFGSFYNPDEPIIIGSLMTPPEPWLIAYHDGKFMITEAFLKHFQKKKVKRLF